MSDTAEVLTKLILDSNAEQELAKIRSELAKVGEEGKKTGGFLSQVGAHALGGVMERMATGAFEMFSRGLHDAIMEVPGLLQEGFHAALGELAGRRQITSALLMGDTSGASFSLMTDRAGAFKDSLEDIGIEAGVTDDALTQVFSEISARSSKSALEIEHLTEAMAYAGKAIPGGVEALGSGFSMMEMGMARARNPVVQLIAATGVLHGNAKQVAAQLMKMTPDKQIELGEKAIEKMAKKMKDMPPTFESLTTSLEGMKGQMFEALGLPMVEALLPILTELKDAFLENKDDIEDAMRGIGIAVGDGFREARDEVMVIKKLLDGSSAGTKEGFNDAARVMTTMWKGGWEQTKAIVEYLIKGYTKVAEIYASMKHAVIGAAMDGSLGSTASEFAHGVEARDIGKSMTDEAGSAANPEDMVKLEALIKKHHDAALAAGESAESVTRFESTMYDLANQNRATGVQMESAAFAMNGDRLIELYNNALKKGDEGSANYAAHLIGQSKELEQALIKADVSVTGGFGGIISRLKDLGERDAATQVANELKKGTKTEKTKTEVNINGATINIKQDFRDQDPERVLAVFRQDLGRAAIQRVKARTSGAFGF
jgi:hypothetical protein